MAQMNWELYSRISNCYDMLVGGGSIKAVKAYIKILLHFYSKEEVLGMAQCFGKAKMKKFVALYLKVKK